MMLSLWQPRHKCLEQMKVEVFMPFGSSISPQFLTSTNVIDSYYGVITLAAWSQLHRGNEVWGIYAFWGLNSTALSHKDYCDWFILWCYHLDSLVTTA